MREEGFGSDAGRPSLTEVGVGGARVSPDATCRLCGIACRPGTKFCPNCGAIQRPDGAAIGSRSRPAEPLPPLPAPRTAPDPVTAAPAAVDARSSPSGAADAPHRALPRAARGERLVAWSSLGVLLVAAVFVVLRLGDLQGGAEPAPAPVMVGAQPSDPPPVPEPSATRLPVATAEPASGLSPAREAIAAARHAAKPASKPKAHASRKPPARNASLPRTTPPVPAVAPAPASAAPERVLVAAAPAVDDARSHWDEMHDEIAACSTGDFLEGVMCQQRIRIRYCEGWWGRAGDCPSRRDDYGN